TVLVRWRSGLCPWFFRNLSCFQVAGSFSQSIRSPSVNSETGEQAYEGTLSLQLDFGKANLGSAHAKLSELPMVREASWSAALCAAFEIVRPASPRKFLTVQCPRIPKSAAQRRTPKLSDCRAPQELDPPL